jgi:DNA-binding MarR family transcriptional regulator
VGGNKHAGGSAAECTQRHRRSVRIKLTDKGREVRDIVDSLYQKHARTVERLPGRNRSAQIQIRDLLKTHLDL